MSSTCIKIFAGKLGVDVLLIRKALEECGLEIREVMVSASGSRGEKVGIPAKDVYSACCCGVPLTTCYFNTCAKCGNDTRCYNCFLGSGECMWDSNNGDHIESEKRKQQDEITKDSKHIKT